mmetsp:Transcript_26923/g.80717  ORF Transcript_26923/g.80717 Transcript_26923/m.80717 type:complete len:363 (-) Transcript_26923:24-1112(-)
MASARRVLTSTDLVSHILTHLSLDDADALAAPCKSWREPRARRLRGFIRPDPVRRIDDVHFRGGITPTTRGTVVVSDYNTNCLKVFDPNGVLLHELCEGRHSFLEDGRGLDTPTAAALLGDGTAWVLCSDTGCVVRLRLETGEHLIVKKDDTMGGSAGLFSAKDLALVGDALLVLCTKYIAVMDAETGAFRRKFADGLLCYEGALAVSGDLVYIADTHNQAIKVFRHTDGSFVRAFGKQAAAPEWDDESNSDDERMGDEPGEFSRPSGVAVANGKLYVSEEKGLRRIQVLSLPDGRALQVVHPTVTIESSGYIHEAIEGERITPRPWMEALGRLAVVDGRLWCYGAQASPTSIYIFEGYVPL